MSFIILTICNISEQKKRKADYIISDGSGTWNPGFGFWKCHEEIVLMQVEQDSSSFFCQIFAIFDDFFKFEHAGEWRCCETLKKHQIFGKKWRKVLFKLPWTYIPMAVKLPWTAYGWFQIPLPQKNLISGTRFVTSFHAVHATYLSAIRHLAVPCSFELHFEKSKNMKKASLVAVKKLFFLIRLCVCIRY